MVVAQQLYEGIDLGKGEGQTGLITYMRTDSVTLSTKALEDCKSVTESEFGREYILSSPRTYKTKSKGAQEAHEAIRPTEMVHTPASLKDVLDTQQLKLYTLIWNRTIATQMAAAQLKRVGVDIEADKYKFRATGQTVLFDGFLRVYTEGIDESDDEKRKGSDDSGDGEKFLPPLSEGDDLDCERLDAAQHFTKPPPRYTEASLVKKMEEEGIGRPSTYAPTISTVQQRGYIAKEGKQLKPLDVAFTVTDLLTEHFPDIVDLAFTAQMEESLDEIADGKCKWAVFLKGFYVPFSALIETKSEEVSRDDVMKERELGEDPETGLPILVRTGRFGPYVQLGRLEEGKDKKEKKNKPKSASLPKNMTKEEVTLEQALSLLSFPRTLGAKEEDAVTVNLGRFGPYIKWGKVTVSLPKDSDPLQVTLEESEVLIKEAKEKRKKAAESLKELGEDPETKKELKVKDGRYGPYVTDGTTNASLGKKFTTEEITLAEASELLKKKRENPKKGKWAKKK
jgi:DNA topoisomerase-1